jgi:hypothetical protein
MKGLYHDSLDKLTRRIFNSETICQILSRKFVPSLGGILCETLGEKVFEMAGEAYATGGRFRHIFIDTEV